MAQQISAIEQQDRDSKMRAAIRAAAEAIQRFINAFKKLFTGRREEQVNQVQQRKQRPVQQDQQKDKKQGQAQGQSKRSVDELKSNISDGINNLRLKSMELEQARLLDGISEDRKDQLDKRGDTLITRAKQLEEKFGNSTTMKELLAVETDVNKALFIAGKVLTADEKQAIEAIENTPEELHNLLSQDALVESYKGGLVVLNTVHGEAVKTGNKALAAKSASALLKFEGDGEEGYRVEDMDHEELFRDEEAMREKIEEIRDDLEKIEATKSISEENKSDIQKVLDGDMTIEALGEEMVEQSPQLAQQNLPNNGQDAGPSISM